MPGQSSTQCTQQAPADLRRQRQASSSCGRQHQQFNATTGGTKQRWSNKQSLDQRLPAVGLPDRGESQAQTMKIVIDYSPGPDSVSRVLRKRSVPLDEPTKGACWNEARPAQPPYCPAVSPRVDCDHSFPVRDRGDPISARDFDRPYPAPRRRTFSRCDQAELEPKPSRGSSRSMSAPQCAEHLSGPPAIPAGSPSIPQEDHRCRRVATAAPACKQGRRTSKPRPCSPPELPMMSLVPGPDQMQMPKATRRTGNQATVVKKHAPVDKCSPLTGFPPFTELTLQKARKPSRVTFAKEARIKRAPIYAHSEASRQQPVGSLSKAGQRAVDSEASSSELTESAEAPVTNRLVQLRQECGHVQPKSAQRESLPTGQQYQREERASLRPAAQRLSVDRPQESSTESEGQVGVHADEVQQQQLMDCAKSPVGQQTAEESSSAEDDSKSACLEVQPRQLEGCRQVEEEQQSLQRDDTCPDKSRQVDGGGLIYGQSEIEVFPGDSDDDTDEEEQAPISGPTRADKQQPDGGGSYRGSGQRKSDRQPSAVAEQHRSDRQPSGAAEQRRSNLGAPGAMEQLRKSAQQTPEPERRSGRVSYTIVERRQSGDKIMRVRTEPQQRRDGNEGREQQKCRQRSLDAQLATRQAHQGGEETLPAGVQMRVGAGSDCQSKERRKSQGHTCAENQQPEELQRANEQQPSVKCIGQQPKSCSGQQQAAVEKRQERHSCREEQWSVSPQQEGGRECRHSGTVGLQRQQDPGQEQGAPGVPDDCQEALRQDAELKRRRELAEEARMAALQAAFLSKRGETQPPQRPQPALASKTDTGPGCGTAEGPAGGVCHCSLHPGRNSDAAVAGRPSQRAGQEHDCQVQGAAATSGIVNWVRVDHKLVNQRSGQPSGVQQASHRCLKPQDIYANGEQTSGGETTQSTNEETSEPQETKATGPEAALLTTDEQLLTESEAPWNSTRDSGENTTEEGGDPVIRGKKKCCC